MQVGHWITIAVALLGATISIYISYRKGDLKKRNVSLHFSASKFTEGVESTFFFHKGKKIPVLGIIAFFRIKSEEFKRICYYIYLTIENRSSNPVEDLTLVIQYPMKYFDKSDKNFFKPVNDNQPSGKVSYIYLTKETLQVMYRFDSIHPNSTIQIPHPISILFSDFGKKLTPENPFFFDVKGTGFSFDQFAFIISAKNLKRPEKGFFWVANVLNIRYTHFFNREKKFFDLLSKGHNHVRSIFEIQIPEKLQIGKFKKDALVAPMESVNISYSHYPHLKEPNSSNFNFEKTDF